MKCLDDLTEPPDLVYAVAVDMSLGLGLTLGSRIALVGTFVAGARSLFGRTGLGVLPLAVLTDAAGDGVGAGGDDGAVVVGVGVRRAGDGREERVRRVAVPAGFGIQAHFLGVCAPWAHGADARVSVLVFTVGAFDFPEVRVVAREGLLDSVLADDGVGVAENVADVVAGPLADGVRFEDGSAVFRRVGLFAYAYLSVVLTYLHAAFGRAIAARHYVTPAVSLVERYFLPGPVDDTIAWGCLCQAVGLFVGEHRGRGRQEEDCVYGSHIDVIVGLRDLLSMLDIVKKVAGESNSGMRYSVVGGLASRVDCNG